MLRCAAAVIIFAYCAAHPPSTPAPTLCFVFHIRPPIARFLTRVPPSHFVAPSLPLASSFAILFRYLVPSRSSLPPRLSLIIIRISPSPSHLSLFVRSRAPCRHNPYRHNSDCRCRTTSPAYALANASARVACFSESTTRFLNFVLAQS